MEGLKVKDILPQNGEVHWIKADNTCVERFSNNIIDLLVALCEEAKTGLPFILPVHALQLLGEIQVLALPIKDESKPNGCAGFIDVLDIVSFLVSCCHSPTAEPLCSKKFLTTPLKEAIDFSHKDQFHTTTADSSLISLVQEFSKGVHRAAVLSESGKVQQIASQYNFAVWLNNNLNLFGTKGQATIKSLNLVKEWVLFARKNETAFQGFQKIAENKVSALAVVDEIGHLVGNLSSSDLRGLNADNFKKLRSHVLSFIKSHRETDVVNICTENSTLEEVVKCIVNHRVHRLWVVDGKNFPIGVISLTDIAGAILSH